MGRPGGKEDINKKKVTMRLFSCSLLLYCIAHCQVFSTGGRTCGLIRRHIINGQLGQLFLQASL